ALRIDIGPLSLDSVVDNPGAFPQHVLPQTESGHWIEVVAVSDDFAIPQPRFHLFLPRCGNSWVCDCPPGGTHHCSAGQRRHHLFLTIHTPPSPRLARLRLGVYFENNLVQSQALTARVEVTEGPGEGHRSWIDYSLTTALRDVGFLPRRALHIMTNRDEHGT